MKALQNMRKPTLVKLLVGVFLVVLLVGATFWYGNAQRAKQLKQRSDGQQAQSSTQQNPQSLPNIEPANPAGPMANNQPTATPPTPTPAAPAQPVQSTQPPAANMPSTGGEGSVIPLTILVTLGYIYLKSRRSTLYK